MLVLIFQSHQDPIFVDTLFGSSAKWLKLQMLVESDTDPIASFLDNFLRIFQGL